MVRILVWVTQVMSERMVKHMPKHRVTQLYESPPGFLGVQAKL